MAATTNFAMTRRLGAVIAVVWLCSCSVEPGAAASRTSSDGGSSAPTTPAARRLAALRAQFPVSLGEPAKAAAVPAADAVHAEPARGDRRPAVRLDMPADAAGATVIGDPESGVEVAFRLSGARGQAAAPEAGVVLYERAVAGLGDLLKRVSARSVEDFIALDEEPVVRELRYAVDVSRVAGLRLVANTLEFLDRRGAPRLRMAPPFVVDAAGLHHDIAVAVEGCAVDRSPSPPWDRPVTAPNERSCTVVLTWRRGLASPALLDPLWELTSGSTGSPRYLHTATLMGRDDDPSARVLVVGGYATALTRQTTSSCGIFDPASGGTWAATSALPTGRAEHTATWLPAAGKVLVLGGNGASTSATLFDPTTGLWQPTQNLLGGRRAHTATRLGNGRVLVVGGYSGTQTVASVEIYEADGLTRTAGPPLAAARNQHTATLEDSGAVLIAGGASNYTTLPVGPSPDPAALPSAEEFDVAGATWHSAGTMNSPRAGHSAVWMPNVGGVAGVLVFGGRSGANSYDTLEFFDGTSWKSVKPAGSVGYAREAHTATYVPALGYMLVVGGKNSTWYNMQTSHLYDPVGNTWSTPPELLNPPRSWHTATLLGTGSEVLVVGGFDGPNPTDGAIVFGAPDLGRKCTTNTECTSGYCVDGLCCTEPCVEGCRSCRAVDKGTGIDGICGPVAGGTDPREGCQDDFPLCGLNGLCDGRGNCAQYRTATGCTPSPCTISKECAQGGFCAAKLANGLFACCDDLCAGSCQACAAADQAPGGGGDGHCGLRASAECGDLPRCSPDRSTLVTAKGDIPCGASACQNKQCLDVCHAPADCAKGFVCLQSKCVPECTRTARGVVVSEVGSANACGAFACQNGVCAATCATEGDCARAVCNGNEECASGFCTADLGGGVRACCDTLCAGSCQTCVAADQAPGGTLNTIPGEDGHCGLRAASECQDLPRCSADHGVLVTSEGDIPCGGFACQSKRCLVAPCETGADCADSFGCRSGTCVKKTTPGCTTDATSLICHDGVMLVACAPYLCRDDACLVGCKSSSDCSPEAACTDGVCVGASVGGDAGGTAAGCGGVCSLDGQSLVSGVNGKAKSCGRYRCRAGACLTMCSSDRACADGDVCIDGQCSAPAEPGPDRSANSGCGCHLVASGDPRRAPREAWWAATLALLVHHRRAGRFPRRRAGQEKANIG